MALIYKKIAHVLFVCHFTRELSWEDAIHWYDEALNSVEENDEGGEYDSTMYDPPHTLMARMADMYLSGGNGLDKMPERAGREITDAN